MSQVLYNYRSRILDLNRELEHNFLVRQRLVHLCECVELRLYVDEVLGVKENL